MLILIISPTLDKRVRIKEEYNRQRKITLLPHPPKNKSKQVQERKLNLRKKDNVDFVLLLPHTYC